jgi:Tfp pilus assembly PilM family ATPase
MFITSSSSYPIGLDISDLSLKLFQLNRSGDKIKIQAVGKYNLPRGLIEDGEIKNKAEVLKAIDQLIDKPKFGKISSKEIIACLPETKTFIKLIEVDITPNDFNETIKTEIEKHIPMSIDEIYYDWQLIKKAGGKQFVLIAAAPKP